jgi:RNA polymerase sigma-70 factor (ECF subfamily)
LLLFPLLITLLLVRKTHQNGLVSEKAKKEIIDALDSLLRYALIMTGNEEDAKDLVQETCYRALKNLNTLDENSNVRAWLFTIMRNIWLNQKKRQQISPIQVGDAIENKSDDLNINSEELLINNEMRQALLKALENLPDVYREILILRYFEDFSYSEISKILGCPLGTVMSRLNRAKEKLKENFVKIYEKKENDRS